MTAPRPRLCLVTCRRPPDDPVVLGKRALPLRDAGWEVVLLAPEKPGFTPPPGLTVLGMPLARHPGRYWVNARAFAALAARQPDIRAYLIEDPDLLPWMLALGRRADRPVIYDCHEHFPLALRSSRDYIPAPLRAPAAWLWDILERRWAAQAAGVISVHRRRLEQLQPDPARRLALDNLPDPGDLPGTVDWEAKDPALMVYAGLLSPQRGLWIMLEAAARLRDAGRVFRLEAPGRFASAGLEARARKALATLGLEGLVFFPGQIPHARVMDLMRRAAIGLIPWLPTPQHREASHPTKLYEYLAWGAVPVAGRYGIFQDVLDPTCAAFVDSLTGPALARTLRVLLDDPEATRSLGRAACARLRDRWQPGESARRLADFLDRWRPC